MFQIDTKCNKTIHNVARSIQDVVRAIKDAGMRRIIKTYLFTRNFILDHSLLLYYYS